MALLKTLPLPDDPFLAQIAHAFNDNGYWAVVLDKKWRTVFVTDELRLSHGEEEGSNVAPIGTNIFGPENVRFRREIYRSNPVSAEYRREMFRQVGPYVLFGFDGDHDALRREIDRSLEDLVDGLRAENPPPVIRVARTTSYFGGTLVGGMQTILRADDGRGNLVGAVLLLKPNAGMSQLAAAAATADLGHLERMRLVERPDR